MKTKTARKRKPRKQEQRRLSTRGATLVQVLLATIQVVLDGNDQPDEEFNDRLHYYVRRVADADLELLVGDESVLQQAMQYEAQRRVNAIGGWAVVALDACGAGFYTVEPLTKRAFAKAATFERRLRTARF